MLLLVAAAATAVVLQAHRDSQQEATNRSLAVAGAFANSPGMAAALRSPDPTAILQPRAEAARKISGVDFVVVTDARGIRPVFTSRGRSHSVCVVASELG